MKAYGMTAQELRELVDAVAFVEAHTGERLEPQEVGDVLGYFCDDGNALNYRGEETDHTRKLNAAGAIIALALGDDRPEFHAMIAKGETMTRYLVRIDAPATWTMEVHAEDEEEADIATREAVGLLIGTPSGLEIDLDAAEWSMEEVEG